MIPLLLLACSSQTAELEVYAWAEATPIDGFAADEMNDGWTVSFDHWYSGVSDVQLADPDTEDQTALDDTVYVADWTLTPEPALVTVLSAASDRHKFSFALDVPTDATPITDVDDADVAEMTANNWAHYVIGSASKDGQEIQFAWGFLNAADYAFCVNGADNTDGVVVDGTNVADIYIHADHIFWDELGTEEAELSFQAIADADADGNGEVSIEELAATSIIDIGYETTGVSVDNLYDFIAFSIAQGGHLNGEGICTVRDR